METEMLMNIHFLITLRCVAGFLFCEWMNTGNKIGSRIKKIGVLFPTRSQMPSSV